MGSRSLVIIFIIMQTIGYQDLHFIQQFGQVVGLLSQVKSHMAANTLIFNPPDLALRSHCLQKFKWLIYTPSVYCTRLFII